MAKNLLSPSAVDKIVVGADRTRMIWTVFQIAIGGAIGSILRYLTVAVITAPLATCLVNVAGSFAMGFLYVSLATRSAISPFLVTGILGGFTTFSAFSLDALRLWQAGDFPFAFAYVVGSVILSLAAVALGAALAKGALG